MEESLLHGQDGKKRHSGEQRVGVLFQIFSSVAKIGNDRPLVVEDVPAFHSCAQCQHNLEMLTKDAIARAVDSTAKTVSQSKFHSARKLFAFLLRHKWRSFLFLNVIKLASCVLSFISPILLGRFVDYFDDDAAELQRGILLLMVLLTSQLLSVILSSQFSLQAAILETELKGAFYLGVFKLALGFRLRETMQRGLTNGQIINVMQIDVDRSIESIKSFIDLWSIPLQVLIAFLLLYYQVNIAFIAGVAAIVLMIPLNSLIARRIGAATSEVTRLKPNITLHDFYNFSLFQLMKHKDSRLSILGEAFKGILGLKSGGLEKDISFIASGHRRAEVKCLSTRKYLDAWCGKESLMRYNFCSPFSFICFNLCF
jgi:ABC-type bacteriocin/lantibiotic exporter with double-glycine peptidase domain